MDKSSKSFLKNFNKKAFFAITALVVVSITCVATIISVYIGIRGYSELPFQHATVSFETAYPFEVENQKPAIDSQNSSSTEHFNFDAIKEFINTYSENIKQPITEYSSGKNILASLYYYVFGATNRLLNRNVIENSESSVYRLKDGRLVYATKYSSAKETYSSISDFSEWLKKRNTEFLFVIPLSIDDDSAIDFPKILETGYKKNNAELINFLTEQKIDYFDTKPFLLSQDTNFYNWFYKTDHHWNVYAGISVADKIVNIMKEDFSFDVDESVCDISNYRSVNYEKVFLGSLGRKVTLGYTDAEDMEILYPVFKTNFHIEIPGISVNKNGTFDETLIAAEYLNTDYYSGNAYGAFLYADEALIRIKNENCDNGVRVLVIKHSKANVVNPYLACAVEYLDIIDPRHFNGSIRTFIKRTNPNLVIVCSTGPVSDTDTNWLLK